LIPRKSRLERMFRMTTERSEDTESHSGGYNWTSKSDRVFLSRTDSKIRKTW